MESCFFCNDTATTEIYTLSLHDALPILALVCFAAADEPSPAQPVLDGRRVERIHPNLRTVDDADVRRLAENRGVALDRKSTRLNSSHATISYAVFCLKNKPTPPPHTSLP